MRAASTMRRSDDRCPECRGGLVCADQWEVWFAQRDDAETAWEAEHGSLDGFDVSELLEERPDCEEEIECVACDGTGFRARRTAPRRSHAA